ncbi:UGSC family (seleno)protein, partial [Candidatus Poribacteria bacterium]
IRHEIGMNWGIGALGPYNHANATIGRAYGLLSQNLQGGSVPGKTYLGSQGNNYAYNSITFAENEERSPWRPFHVQHGFKPEDSVVSVFSGVRSTSYNLGLRETYWREHVRDMLRGINPRLAPTFVLDPITARQFIDRGGFDTKEKLIQWIHDTAVMPAGQYWDYQLVQNYIYPRALNGEEPYAKMLKAADDELINVYQLKQIHVVVVGGETNGYWRIMGCGYGKSVSIDDWR